MSIEKVVDKKKRKHLPSFRTFISCFLISFYCIYLLGEDQYIFIKSYWSMRNEPVISANVVDFYTPVSVRWPPFYYSEIEYEQSDALIRGLVIRADKDFIGRKIKVKKLENGDYIRSGPVLTQRSKSIFFMFLFVFFLMLIGIVRRRQRRLKE